MASAYLLPCTCGRKVTVNRAQAGTTVPCRCGRQIEVPTIRDMQRLQPAGESEDGAAAWTAPKAIVLLSSVVLVLCLGGIVALVVFKTIRIHKIEREIAEFDQRWIYRDPENHERIRKQAREMSAADAWIAWREMESGIERSLGPNEQRHFEQLEEGRAVVRNQAAAYNFWIWIVAALAVVAAIGIVLGWQLGRGRSMKK